MEFKNSALVLQLDHGVIPMLFELVGDYARDKFGATGGNKRLANANKRFRSFRNSHPGLRLPNIDFLGGSSFVTAFEHRHSLSVRRLQREHVTSASKTEGAFLLHNHSARPFPIVLIDEMKFRL